MSNPHEVAARLAKVAAIVAICRKHGITQAEARAATGPDRLLAARAARVAGKNGDRVPSDESWALVVEGLGESRGQ